MTNEITLKDKIGQMLIVGFQGVALTPDAPIVQAILAQRLGGVILFDFDYQTKTDGKNIQSPQQVQALTQQLREYAKQAAIIKKNYLSNLLIGVDYEGGSVNRLKEKYGFPKTYSAAEMGQSTLGQVQQYAEQMAMTLQKAGINLNFAPLLDVNVNPNNPIIGKLGRSFSDDPQKVIECATLFSKAYRDHGIRCVYKHFPGHGSSTGDTHAGFVDVTQTWEVKELEPYQSLLQQPDAAVMTAHVVHTGLDSNGYPASLSAHMTTDLLRKKLHFDGVVMTDDMQMKAITDHYSVTDAVTLAINAGADMLIFGNQLTAAQDPQQLVDIIYDAVQSGRITTARIEEAYGRVVGWKGLNV